MAVLVGRRSSTDVGIYQSKVQILHDKPDNLVDWEDCDVKIARVKKAKIMKLSDIDSGMKSYENKFFQTKLGSEGPVCLREVTDDQGACCLSPVELVVYPE